MAPLVFVGELPLLLESQSLVLKTPLDSHRLGLSLGRDPLVEAVPSEMGMGMALLERVALHLVSMLVTLITS